MHSQLLRHRFSLLIRFFPHFCLHEEEAVIALWGLAWHPNIPPPTFPWCAESYLGLVLHCSPTCSKNSFTTFQKNLCASIWRHDYCSSKVLWAEESLNKKPNTYMVFSNLFVLILGFLSLISCLLSGSNSHTPPPGLIFYIIWDLHRVSTHTSQQFL